LNHGIGADGIDQLLNFVHELDDLGLPLVLLLLAVLLLLSVDLEVILACRE
jgi:hypothetical protein